MCLPRVLDFLAVYMSVHAFFFFGVWADLFNAACVRPVSVDAVSGFCSFVAVFLSLSTAGFAHSASLSFLI